MKIKSILGFLMVIFPSIAFGAMQGLSGFLEDIYEIVKLLIPVIVGIAMIYFFWGVTQFILHGSEEKTRDDGKKKMLWGIIALFVLFSINGILNIIGDTLDIQVDNTAIQGSPGTLPGSAGGLPGGSGSGFGSGFGSGSGSGGSRSFNPPNSDCGNGTDVLCIQDNGDGGQ